MISCDVYSIISHENHAQNRKKYSDCAASSPSLKLRGARTTGILRA
jgi:hypothetical protein